MSGWLAPIANHCNNWKILVPHGRLGNDAIWLTALQDSGVSALEWRFLGMHVVLTPAHKSSRRPAIYPRSARRIPLQFPGFGVIDVITRTIAARR
jgi:hypothetical protein